MSPPPAEQRGSLAANRAKPSCASQVPRAGRDGREVPEVLVVPVLPPSRRGRQGMGSRRGKERGAGSLGGRLGEGAEPPGRERDGNDRKPAGCQPPGRRDGMPGLGTECRRMGGPRGAGGAR